MKENDALNEDIKDLIDRYVVIEELARSKMGMIKHGEILLRVYPLRKKAPKLKVNND